jgi:F-type H+-transporting ATPase subunit a
MMAADTDGPLDIGEMVLHHTADAYGIGMDPFWHIAWPSDLWVIHVGNVALNLTPTKHVIFMVITALLVFLTLWVAGRRLTSQRAGGQAPKGFANAVEALVLFVRNDIALANIGHDGHKFVPLIITLFFFVLYANLLGLLPWGASATGNLAVTGALAILVFLVIEIGGMRKLGLRGYMGTIFPPVPGLSGAGAVVMSVAMAPIEILGKVVKPFALAVRLFGNMTAGHFVILSLFGIIFMFGALPGWNWAIGFATAFLVLGIMLLELIVALLQAYVFALLSSVFIGLMQHEH